MQKEKKLVPKLRFSEFEGEWKRKEFKEVVKINQGLQIAIADRLIEPKNGALFYITNEFLNPKSDKRFYIENASNSVICDEDDILMTRTGNTGKVVTNVSGAFHNNFFRIAYPTTINKQYLYNFLILPKTQNFIQRLAGTSTIPDLNHSDFYKIKFTYPPKPEQQKIAIFLTSIDTQIQTLEKKKIFLEQYKKGVMQKIFKQEIKFKDKNGNDFEKWKKFQLIDISERIKTKNKVDNQNVLTISAQLGLVSQLEYFNKSVSAKNLTGYYLLEKNDFAYNKSYSKGYPMGAIKRLDKYDLGVVSTLYICFRFNAKVSLDFMEQYFEAGLQNKEIEKVAQEGARNHGLLNIGVNDFFEIDLKLPSLKEQIKIADFLSAIDKNIALVNTRIEHTKSYKKGLLQQMFV